MTDADYKKHKVRIQKLIKRWVRPLGLCWWKMNFVYDRNDGEFIRKAADGYATAMTCSTKWEYLEAEIRINMLEIAGLSDEDLEVAFVHELCHVFVNEMREWKGKESIVHEERVVTQLANAFFWLRRDIESKRKK